MVFPLPAGSDGLLWLCNAVRRCFPSTDPIKYMINPLLEDAPAMAFPLPAGSDFDFVILCGDVFLQPILKLGRKSPFSNIDGSSF